MKLKRGEKLSLELGEYSFEFEGPVEVSEDKLDALRGAVQLTDLAEQAIRTQQERRIGFDCERTE